MGEVLYEERIYPAGNWVSVTRGEELYEQSISLAFMKLMRFICKENSSGKAPPTNSQRSVWEDITEPLAGGPQVSTWG